jgi:uncharacterized protein YndB with AHSA1/START domain
MTGSDDPQRVLGSLHTDNGMALVRIEERLGTSVDDVWAALTDPQRLARWLGEVSGDLRLDGELRARFSASGWEGTGRVQACEPPHRLLVQTWAADQEGDYFVAVSLSAAGDQTLLVWEERGMPRNLIAEYGAGIQVQVEDLIAHVAGDERCDGGARWAQLHPAYAALAAELEYDSSATPRFDGDTPSAVGVSPSNRGGRGQRGEVPSANAT